MSNWYQEKLTVVGVKLITNCFRNSLWKVTGDDSNCYHHLCRGYASARLNSLDNYGSLSSFQQSCKFFAAIANVKNLRIRREFFIHAANSSDFCIFQFSHSSRLLFRWTIIICVEFCASFCHRCLSCRLSWS